MIKLTAIFNAMLIFLGTFFAGLLPAAPKALSASELAAISDTVKKQTLSDTVYAVNLSGFSTDERYSAIALQGIVAKKDPCIYFLFGSAYNTYLKDIEESGKTVIRTAPDGKNWTYESLILQFRDYIGDFGYTLYENSDYAEGLNVAVNFASAYGWLPITPQLKEKAESCGLSMKKDLTQEKYGYTFQRKYFNELKDHFEKGTVVHVKTEMMGLRDLAIEQGYFCFYTVNDTSNIAGNGFMKEVLRWSGKGTTVFGWCEYEKKTVKLVSEMGCNLVAADYSYNCSYLSQFEAVTDYIQPLSVAHTDESKHYVTLVFSDGDNCQWIENGYGEYHTLTKNFPEAKISWTFSPRIRELCPAAYIETLKDANENTSFVCGPSGFGYCSPSLLDREALDIFSTKTASAMMKSGERVITILDDYKPIKEGKMAKSFSFFSRFDNIDGGILYLDPDRYEAGKGKVWFSDDKPFASVRLSLWSTKGYEGATDEWIREQADKVNSYPVDVHSIDGYSVICIHAWSMEPAAVNKFIGMLDDHVEILSANDFLKTLTENIPHKTAVPATE